MGMGKTTDYERESGWVSGIDKTCSSRMVIQDSLAFGLTNSDYLSLVTYPLVI